MQTVKIGILALAIVFAMLSLVACSDNAAPSSSAEQPSQSESTQPPSSQPAPTVSQEEREYFADLSEADEKLYQTLTQERGLQEWQIHSLTSTGFTFQDIAELPDEEIAKILAPGSSFMGDYLSEEEFNKLIDSGISEEDVYVLNSLGYDYDSAVALTPEQRDFIFPNTELVDNLVALGYDRDVVQAAGFLSVEGGYETYKALLDEVFEKYPNGTK